MTYSVYCYINWGWIMLAVVTFIILLRVTAPFGRHNSSGWGPQIDNRLGWFLMEIPGMLTIAYLVVRNRQMSDWITLLPLLLYFFHYINRVFVFPLRIRTRGKKMPLLVALMAVCFNLMNGFLLGYYFAHYALYSVSDYLSVHAVSGFAIFCAGVIINWKYDNRLIRLRPKTDKGYVIPAGGLFNSVSCPNLLGETIEWLGFAVFCWNLPALSFFVWTIANLVPRALSHHRWYQTQFPDYPAERKALIPRLV